MLMSNSTPKKRILVIEDLSFAGRCSSLIASPVISAAGHECCVLPTMLLSTHTGFEGAKKKSTINFALTAAEHYKQLGLHFDAIYTGYMGGDEELETTTEIVDMLREKDTLLVVDPAFGDAGKLYSGYCEDYPAHMRWLCSRADVILPNITEAEFLAGVPHSDNADPAYACALLESLFSVCDTGAAVLSGVRNNNEITAVAKNKRTGESVMCGEKRVNAHYFGAGDLFASVFVSLLVKSGEFAEAVKKASAFTSACVADTYALGGADPRFGVSFEGRLSELGSL